VPLDCFDLRRAARQHGDRVSRRVSMKNVHGVAKKILVCGSSTVLEEAVFVDNQSAIYS
jgi:hypothetical protein